MSDRLFIFDTTLRDGEQVPGCQLNTVEKIQVDLKGRDLADHLCLDPCGGERYRRGSRGVEIR